MVKINTILTDTYIVDDDNRNYGADQILELSSNRKILLKLKTNNILSTKDYFLNLTIANAKYLKNEFKIKVCPLLQDWVEGNGFKDSPSYDGANFYNNGQTAWQIPFYDEANCKEFIFTGDDILTNKLILNLNGLDSIPNGLIIITDTPDTILYIYSRSTNTIFYPKLIEHDKEIVTIGDHYIRDDDFKILEFSSRYNRTPGVEKFKFIAKKMFIDVNFSNEFTFQHERFSLPPKSYLYLEDASTKDVILSYDMNIILDYNNLYSYKIIDLQELTLNRIYAFRIKSYMGDLIRESEEINFYLGY